jgi:hypothetical protein
LLQVLGISALSLCGGRATRLVACGLFLGAVVASFAGVALGWRFEAALGVVVVVWRVRRVVELACLVVGEPSGAAVARIPTGTGSRSVIANSGIEDAVDDVGDQVEHDNHDSTDH